MNKYKRLGKNIIFQTIGKFSSKLLVFFLVPLYTSMMTTEEYGIADYINVTVTLLYPILTIVIAEAEARFALDKNENISHIFTFSNFVGLAGVFAAVLLSPLLRLIPIINDWYMFFLVALTCYIFYEIFVHFSIGLDRFSTVAAAGIINTLSNISSVIIFLLFFNAGVKGYILSSIIGNLTASLFIFFKERLYRYYINIFKVEKDLIKRMVFYSVPMIPNSISWWINNSVDKYMMEFYNGVSAMALLSVAYKIPSILVTVVGIFVSAWHVSSVEHFGTDENKIFFQKIYKLFNLVITVFMAACVSFTKEISAFLFKTDFYNAWIIVPILLFAYVFQSEATFLGSVFTANKNTGILFISTLVGSVVNISVNIIMIPRYSGFGAAVATLFGYMVICIIRYVFALKIIPLKVQFKNEGVCIFILIIMTAIAYKGLALRVISCILGIAVLLVIQRKPFVFLLSELKQLYKK